MKSCGSKVDIEGSGAGGGKASVSILEQQQQTHPGHTNGLAQLHRFQQPNGSAGPGLPLIIEKVGVLNLYSHAWTHNTWRWCLLAPSPNKATGAFSDY